MLTGMPHVSKLLINKHYFPIQIQQLSKIQFIGLFQFCGPCLRNRYGEEAREVLKNPVSSCKYSETPHEDHL